MGCIHGHFSGAKLHKSRHVDYFKPVLEIFRVNVC